MLHSHFRPHFLPFYGQHLYSHSAPTRFLHLLHLSIFPPPTCYFIYFTLLYSLFSSPPSIIFFYVPLVEFMYLVVTPMSSESYRRSQVFVVIFVLRISSANSLIPSVFFTLFFCQFCSPCFSVHFLGLYLHLSMQSLYLLLLSTLLIFLFLLSFFVIFSPSTEPLSSLCVDI